MSLLILGQSELAVTIGRYLIGFDDIVRNNGVSSSFLSQLDLAEPFNWSMQNKYYSADISVIHRRSHLECTPIQLDAEGLLVVANAQETVSLEGCAQIDDDKAVKLLVLLNNGLQVSQHQSEQNLSWALDHGFEYIEIDESNLLQDLHERDKTGLPRLIEALASTMWTTMKKKNRSHQEDVIVPVVGSPAQTDSSHNVCTATAGNESNIEDNDDFDIDDFARLMQQAQSLHARAHAGLVNDDERRKNAAMMAFQMCQMLQLEEESETEEELF